MKGIIDVMSFGWMKLAPNEETRERIGWKSGRAGIGSITGSGLRPNRKLDMDNTTAEYRRLGTQRQYDSLIQVAFLNANKIP